MQAAGATDAASGGAAERAQGDGKPNLLTTPAISGAERAQARARAAACPAPRFAVQRPGAEEARYQEPL